MDVLFTALAATGAVVWLGMALVLAWITRVGIFHAIQAWGMSGRIVRESTTKRPRYRWWWSMFWKGPVTSLTTADDNHTIYWPGREPAGWYSDDLPSP